MFVIAFWLFLPALLSAPFSSRPAACAGLTFDECVATMEGR